ncbi:MAG: hypoxanthine phosphoribosyltransferase [Bacilli bacterium]|nr:hypoxanthine phosphoribosyltransferase [Bacilli bacterium]
MDNFVEEVLLNHDQIVEASSRLGKVLTEEYKDKFPILIGLLKGSVPFLAELIKHIDCDIELDFMQVSSYRGVKSTGTVVMLKDIVTSVKDRHVLLVEDIVDTGLTLKEVMHVLDDRGAKSIEVVTLLDKPENRVVEMKPKYVGHTIPNKFVIGFGLDFNEKYRNLNYIGVLKESEYKK